MNVIYEVRNYTDEVGRSVIEKVPVSILGNTPTTPKPDVPTTREGLFGFKTPMGTMKASFEFPPEFKTIEECFEKFDELAQAKADEIEKEIQSQIAVSQKGIAVPAGRNKGGIIIP